MVQLTAVGRRTIEEAFRQHACDMESAMSVLSKTGNFLPKTFSGSPSLENENINRSAPVPLT